jgi:uncharacterized membrane protein YraQ (UPF0718 family)
VSSDQLSVESPVRHAPRGALPSVTILLAICSALVVYKSGSALRTLQNANATGTLVATANLLRASEGSALVDALSRTVRYLAIVSPALLFGILVAGAVRAFVSPAWLSRIFTDAPIRQQLTAGLAGAPLMLCSCCVAPVFSAVRERTGRLGPSLAVALAAPSLNPAALALTYMLFRPRIATMRLALGLAAVFLVSPGIARAFPGKRATPVKLPAVPTVADSVIARLREFIVSSAHIAIRTVPLLAVGVVAAMWMVGRLPTNILTSVRPEAATALMAIVAVPVAVPTFFEIPLALTLLSIGAPAGAAVALLFAGPAVNLPSLLAIGRTAGWSVAVALAVTIAALACAGGLLVRSRCRRLEAIARAEHVSGTLQS